MEVPLAAMGSEMLRMKPWKRKPVSVGPPQTFGWNCTENQGRWQWLTPSLLPSLAWATRGTRPLGRESLSTAKPWF
eukprot:7856750-Lingulodinium_polyedra.AAC.1